MYVPLLLESACWIVLTAIIEKLNEKIYNKITTYAKDLVATGEKISAQYGIPIVNKRISVTPIGLIGGAACKTTDDFVTIARTWTKLPSRWE